jgi:hypothetical protein
MHPYIHPPKENINRPENNHQYIKPIHSYPTSCTQKNILYIPNPYQYQKNYIPTHYLHHSEQKYSEIWNQLQHTIRVIKNIKKFKKSLASHIQKTQNEN